MGRLVGTEHADRRSGIPRAVLETDPVTSISVALRPVDASHHAGLAHHAGQRAGEKRGLVRTKGEHGQIGHVRRSHDRIDQQEVRRWLGPGDVDYGIRQEKATGDHQVDVPVRVRP